MSYQLVVSEKPSVGAAYAKVLGATNRQDGYWEGNGYLVSWCVGHLVELAPPNVYDARYVKWSVADLPILPQKWQYLVSASTKKQFGILKELMHRPDVDIIVNSCDAGREGELIFRLVYQQAGCKKPFSRLWLSSMEESAIREGFAHLKSSTEYDALYNAALCRERADWMVGINASRLFSCLYGQPLAVGRVMTPVLAMTVVREAAIAAFTPEKFYTVDLELTSGCTASSRRIPEKSVAENLLKACRKEMVATIQRITRKEKSENPPPLYDLTTLQRDANRLLGYSAQQTLDYVQSLYEKKLTTYPRTDSCYITDDDEEMLEELTEELERFLDITPADADEAVPRTQRTVNREKVTDHHAILPTRSMLQADLEALPKGEQNILKLIIARTLMAVSKPFRYLETLLTTECAGEEFTAKGKEVLEEGWKAVERKVLADILNRKQELTALPNATENECGILNAELKEGQTSPPKHFTEDTLLHAMETASADSMPQGVERQGIGTPATRAATIEKLVQKGFLERKGTKKTKVLLPTDKGKALITVMPEEIQSPEMTADWETKLLQIERSEMEPETFMTEIKEMISSLVTTTEAAKGANALMVYDDKKAAGERLLLARQEMPNADMMLLGTYRGFELNIRFDSFKNEHQAVLRAELSYPVSLGDDARGNITRLDNAIDNFADRIADAENALQNLEQQKQAAEIEVAKPFAQEEELAEKSARLAELNALLNIDRDRSSSQDTPEEAEETEAPATRPSVLAALEEKANQPEPVKPFKSYLDKEER